MKEPVAQIVAFETGHAADFRELNLEWLRKYFVVEPIDEDVLSHPERIIAGGGAIFIARCDGRSVGTVALMCEGDGRYELTKMAVTAEWQRKGISRQLLDAAIGAFRENQGRELYLESSKTLTPALTLYESAGFEHAPRPPGPVHYQRGDVYMVFKG